MSPLENLPQGLETLVPASADAQLLRLRLEILDIILFQAISDLKELGLTDKQIDEAAISAIKSQDI